MKRIDVLKAQRAAVQQKVAALAAIETAGTALSAEQVAEFNKLSAEFDDIGEQIARLERAEKMAAATAEPVRDAHVEVGTKPARKMEKGDKLAAVVLSVAHGGKDLQAAARFAEDLGAPEVAASLNAGTAANGGYIVPPDYRAELIEFLRETSSVRAAGAIVLDMPTGAMTMGKQNSGATAGYTAELANIGKTEPDFAQVSLAAKKLTALVPVSNDLIRRANPSALAIVRQDLIEAAAEREGVAFLRGDGTSNTPTGLNSRMLAGNKVAANATINLANVAADLAKLDLKIMSAKHKGLNQAVYIMSPRSFVFLTELRDGNGNRVYPSLDQFLLKGRRVIVDTSIPENLGAGTNESEVYLGLFKHAIIGESMDLTISASDTAAYYDGSAVVSAFSRDETAVRMITEHDFNLRHTNAFAKLEAVKWA